MSRSFEIKEKDTTQEFALYTTKYGSFLIISKGSCLENDPDYVRVSEYVTHTFSLRKKADIILNAVANVDQSIAVELFNMEKRLQDLRNYKQTLLAITYEEKSNVDIRSEYENLDLAAESGVRDDDD